MEPSKEAIAVRLTRLNRLILGKVTGGSTHNFSKRTIDREALLDALTVLYDECNEDPVKKTDELVRAFVDKYRSSLAELRRIRVCIADFETLQIIGRGHFGDVHMVREKQTGDVYALKTLRKETVKSGKTSAEEERDVLAATAGAWLPRLQYAFQDSTNLYLVMELCSGGDLAGLLSRRSHPLCERDAAFYVAEVAHALRALHNLGFVHRDVKPENILLDRTGHVKLGDFGSSARLSDSSSSPPAATADYLAPELLAVADCAARHAVCLECCRGVQPASYTACDYWSLGVIAFELVTLRRPFSSGDNDSIALILSNIQKYERDGNDEPPFDPLPAGPSEEWRHLTGGLLRVRARQRYHYMDTLQHKALRHLSSHSIRDQVPPWVPSLRGPEDASHFAVVERAKPAVNAAPFRTRAPFAGQLPFVGFSYVAPEETEDSMSSGFNASHDCTAIDLATFKSAEKLAAMRSKEIATLQKKLAAAEAAAGAEAERQRRQAEDEAERQRARLQAEITALSLQNKRLERQIEIDKEERMALERTNSEISSSNKDRHSIEHRKAQATICEMECERDQLRGDYRRLEAKVAELQAEVDRSQTAADTARAQQRHYKDIIEHVHELRHRRLTELNVRPIESMAKERALRRQTLSGCEADSREAATRLAQAEAIAAKEQRARDEADKKLAKAELQNRTLQIELDNARRDLTKVQESFGEKKRLSEASSEELKQVQLQLTEERVKSSSLQAQVQELQRAVEEAARRDLALEEQRQRTVARLQERLEEAETRAADTLKEDARHREKVNTLEQLVRQLEREVSALEARGDRDREECKSDTESVEGMEAGVNAQVTLLKEQLQRAENLLQARTEEMAALRQEARAANLARWRKEREFNELQLEAKTSTRELKRIEERLASATEARKAAEQKATVLQAEVVTLKPLVERSGRELERVKEKLERLEKEHEIAQAEVERSRNDIRKLKSELQYSEKRRIRAEEQEELGSRERAQLRDEAAELRASAQYHQQNNKALQEACSLLEEQLTDLERLSDLHEMKNKDLENETQRLRTELTSVTSRLSEAERVAQERNASALRSTQHAESAQELAHNMQEQLEFMKERLDNREARVAELESLTAELEEEKSSIEAAFKSAMRQMRALQEESSSLRTRAQEHHTHALQLQAQLADAQEEISAAREAADSAAAWWRTRETKADATLRQQAKLIDFLQVKVEEAKRKKSTLSNKLFGRTGRRPAAASPPLRNANRELREEIERLRSKLAALECAGDGSFHTTPRRDKKKQVNSRLCIDAPDGVQNGGAKNQKYDDSVQIVWCDGSGRDRVQARCADGVLVFNYNGTQLRARLLTAETSNLPQNEAIRAFTIKIINPENSPSEAAVITSSLETKADWITRLTPAHSSRYAPKEMTRVSECVNTAVYVAPNALAIGCEDGLHSLRGSVQLTLSDTPLLPAPLTALTSCSGRIVMLHQGTVLHGGMLSLGSALRRASTLRPTMNVARMRLSDAGIPHLIQGLSGDTTEGPCLAVACGRRVFLLRYDAAAAEFKVSRSLTVDRPPASLLLTHRALYIAGEKPLKINLPSGALESFAMDDLVVAAAAKKHSPPKAILLIKDNPVEILICYAECGVFVDENGKRTRSDDPKWSSAISKWEFVNPFLYLIGNDAVTINYVNEETYKGPPCTCDNESLSSYSDCYAPHVFNLKVDDVKLLGTAPNGILISSKLDNDYCVSIVEGMLAFRSIGASVESLATTISNKGSSTDLAQSITDISPQETSQDVSQESIEPHTGFLADIKKRAKQLRAKNNRKASQTPDDVIKQILTTEVGLKKNSMGRRSPATISEFSDSDSSESKTDVEKTPADLCAEMFTRQVRFQS